MISVLGFGKISSHLGIACLLPTMKVKHPIFLASLVSCSASSASAYSATDHSFFRSISAAINGAGKPVQLVYAFLGGDLTGIVRTTSWLSVLNVLQRNLHLIRCGCAEPCERLVNGFLLTGKIQDIRSCRHTRPWQNAKHPRIIQIRWKGLSVIMTVANGVFSSTNSIPCSVNMPLPDCISSRPSCCIFRIVRIIVQAHSR